MPRDPYLIIIIVFTLCAVVALPFSLWYRAKRIALLLDKLESLGVERIGELDHTPAWRRALEWATAFLGLAGGLVLAVCSIFIKISWLSQLGLLLLGLGFVAVLIPLNRRREIEYRVLHDIPLNNARAQGQ